MSQYPPAWCASITYAKGSAVMITSPFRIDILPRLSLAFVWMSLMVVFLGWSVYLNVNIKKKNEINNLSWCIRIHTHIHVHQLLSTHAKDKNDSSGGGWKSKLGKRKRVEKDALFARLLSRNQTIFYCTYTYTNELQNPT